MAYSLPSVEISNSVRLGITKGGLSNENPPFVFYLGLFMHLNYYFSFFSSVISFMSAILTVRSIIWARFPLKR